VDQGLKQQTRSLPSCSIKSHDDSTRAVLPEHGCSDWLFVDLDLSILNKMLETPKHHEKIGDTTRGSFSVTAMGW
jgi:hypothetical protein